jgi:putative spermidine/putrescine transport system permease protein
MSNPAVTRRYVSATALAAPALLFLLVFLIVPVASLLASSFEAPTAGGGAAAGYIAAADPNGIGFESFLTSLGVSLIVTVVVVVIGVPFAIIMVRASPAGRAVLTVALFVPLLTSEVVLAYGWLIVLGRNGLVSSTLRNLGIGGSTFSLLYSVPAVVLGLVTLLLPFFVIPVVTALSSINPEVYRAAEVLGARSLGILLRVTLPIIAPAMLSGAVIVYALGMSSYAVPLVLGGANVHTTTLLVYTQYMVLFDRPSGSALAVILLLLVAIPTIVLMRLRSSISARR